MIDKDKIIKDGETKNTPPTSDLDYNMKIIENTWGKEGISKELFKKLINVKSVSKDDDGVVTVDYDSLWSMLGFYTRDLRLSNLDSFSYRACEHYLNLANDLLNSDDIGNFLICLSRVATIIEISQSKGGFLRKQMNTLTQKNEFSGLDEAQKKSFITGRKNTR